MIRRLARENPLWGEERIANELRLKLGIRVSPRTVGKYMPKSPPGRPRGDQHWATFLRNHAKVIVACDLLVIVTASFRLLYILVVVHHESRRLLHVNVTRHPTAAWTLQQLREAIVFEETYCYLIHDRDSLFSKELDESINGLGLKVLKAPVRSPKANALCERVIGTLRRECLDGILPLSEPPLRRVLKEWVAHYNEGRPHMALGPGIPSPPVRYTSPSAERVHRRAERLDVRSRPVLGGLHHEYSLVLA